MRYSQPFELREQTLARIALATSDRPLGRTQIMKLFYFLQELYGIDLNYDFRLYNHGPYASEVLSDLSIAYGRNIVKEEAYHYSGGYGYRITPSDNAKTVSIDLDSSYADIVDRAINEFGTRTAAELELRSTIMFVDREFHQSNKLVTEIDVSNQVREIKPHFTESRILETINDMNAKQQLRSLSSSVADASGS